MLLSVSDFVSELVVRHRWRHRVLVVAGFIAMRRSPAGRARLDAIILKLPVLGDLVQTAVLERICRILSSMIRAGVALPEAMRVTAELGEQRRVPQGVSRQFGRR